MFNQFLKLTMIYLVIATSSLLLIDSAPGLPSLLQKIVSIFTIWWWLLIWSLAYPLKLLEFPDPFVALVLLISIPMAHFLSYRLARTIFSKTMAFFAVNLLLTLITIVLMPIFPSLGPPS